MGRLARVVLLAGIVVGAAATVAWATGLTTLGFVGGDGTITVCVQTNNGDVRFIDPSSSTKDLASCRPAETQLTLNQRGPQGPPGPPGSSPGPANVVVDCGSGGSIQHALDQNQDATSVHITVNGTCVESVQIHRDNVTLVSGPSGGGIQAPSSDACVVCLNQSRFVFLGGLTLTGGSAGIGPYASTVTVNDVHITGASTAVQAGSGTVVALNNVAIDNCQQGIDTDFAATVAVSAGSISGCQNTSVAASSGGSVVLRNGVSISNSQFQGLAAFKGGSIEVDDATINGAGNQTVYAFGGSIELKGANTVVSGSAFCGANAEDGGQVAVFEGARISGNHDGVCANNGGSILIQNGAIVESNNGDGVHLIGGSSLRIQSQSIIRNNTGNGIHAGDTSVVSFNDNTDQITGNGGAGILCDGPPSVAVYRGDPGTVSGNGGPQIACQSAGG